jgi:putative FmdB family regulatory protein
VTRAGPDWAHDHTSTDRRISILRRPTIKSIMPTYEYECENGHVFEEFQSIVAAPLDVCPVCSSPARRRISGGTGLIFKGSGFYVNDYARKGGRSKENAEKKSESKPADSVTKTDAPPPPAQTGSALKGGDSGSS